jgi:hypothetical protein
MTASDPVPAVFVDVCKREGWERTGSTAVVPLPGERRQVVGVDLLVVDGDELMRLYTRVGEAAVLNEARLLAALRMNARLRCGAISILDTDLALVDIVPLADARADAVRASILYLARQADDFERALFGRDVH